MKNIIYSFSKEEMRQLMQRSTYVKDVIESIGLRDAGNNRTTLFKVIATYSLDLELIELKKRSIKAAGIKAGTVREIPVNEAFVKNSTVRRNNLKQKIFKYNLLPYICASCGNLGEWNGTVLVLQLEHKNGIHNDNRLKNLCFLCPNCHSQTQTFAGKNCKKAISNRKEKALAFQQRAIKRKLFVDERCKFLDSIDRSKIGWLKVVQAEWGVQHGQAKRWIVRNYPTLEYYER